MASTPDKVIDMFKKAKGPGDVFAALAADPYLAIGIVSILALIYLFGRIYIWPQINPFKVQWISNFWDWLTSPRPPSPSERYPYAKVTYRQ